MHNTLLLILSSVFSVVVGYYFSKLSNSEKIDTIANASTEKMVHLSLQLLNLSMFLKKTIQMGIERTENDEISSALAAYEHRINAAAIMTDTLSTSSEVFRGDWLGVVSPETKSNIEKKHAKLRSYRQDSEILEKYAAANENWNEGQIDSSLMNKIEEIELRMEETEKHLPLHSVSIPNPRYLRPLAVQVEQAIHSSSATTQTGSISLTIMREVGVATGSGKLSPKMKRIPEISAKLVKAPEGFQAELANQICKTGTKYDFNIHIRPTSKAYKLPLGTYSFNYEAKCQIEEKDEPPKTDNGA